MLFNLDLKIKKALGVEYVYDLFNRSLKEIPYSTIGTVEVDGIKTFLTKEGKISRYQQTVMGVEGFLAKLIQTKTFQKWIAKNRDNFAIDEDTNEPIVVFHGSKNRIGVEGLEPRWHEDAGVPAIFFADKPRFSKNYAREHFFAAFIRKRRFDSGEHKWCIGDTNVYYVTKADQIFYLSHETSEWFYNQM